MSELDATLLMRHTKLLLRFYPPAYRAHRGEEIFDTLLDTTRPGRGWPPAREVASVIGGGVRARRAANLDQGLRASLRHVAILAAAMILVPEPIASLAWLVQQSANAFHPHYRAGLELGLALECIFAVTALAAVWCGRRWLVAAAGGAAVLAGLAGYHVYDSWSASTMLQLPTAAALVILLPLTKRGQRPPVSLWYLTGLTCLTSLAVNVVPGLAAALAPPRIPVFRAVAFTSPYLTTYLDLLPVLVAVCWLVTDVRPLAAVTLQFLLWRVIIYAQWNFLYRSDPGQTEIATVAGLSLALLCALVWLLRHRVRTASPAAW